MAKIRPARNGSKKEVILKSAAALFRAKGFKASSMRELATTLGIEAPSLYNHIGSKTELLEEICFTVAAHFTQHMQQVQQSQSTELQKLEAIIRFHIRMMLEWFDELYISNYEWKNLPQPQLSAYLEERKQYEAGMLLFIQDGIENASLQNINAQAALITILSALRGLEHGNRFRQELPGRLLEDEMVHHLLNGITR